MTDSWRTAISATLHCLTGCAIGEVLGMVIGTALGWGNWPTVAISVVLAFAFGYSLTMLPLLRAGLAFAAAAPLALASDTLSIAVMEIVDNTVMLLVPGALDAGLDERELLRRGEVELGEPLGLGPADVAGGWAALRIRLLVMPDQGLPVLVARRLHGCTDVRPRERHDAPFYRRLAHYRREPLARWL